MQGKLDQDRDGIVSDAELAIAQARTELEITESKAETQKQMAWSAMISMIVFTGLLFTPLFALDKITSLADVLDVFYIAQAGIVGAYFGITAWMSRKG